MSCAAGHRTRGLAEEREALFRERCRGLRGASKQSTHLCPLKSQALVSCHVRGHLWLREHLLRRDLATFLLLLPPPALALEDADTGKGVEEQEGMKGWRAAGLPARSQT